MRFSHVNGPLRLKVITGTRVVLMAWDLDASARTGLRGFAIQRLHPDRPAEWMTGTRYFEQAVNGRPAPDAEFSTREHPLQTFLWSDYEAWAGQERSFRLVALYGEPGALTEGPDISFTVTTEPEHVEGGHSVFFNRGAIASRAFADDYHNKKITDAMAADVSDAGRLNDKTVSWLSRGLAEACLRFINTAAPGEGLRVCAYEFTYLPVLQALQRALARGVDVRIAYHYSKKPGDDNLDAIQAAGIPEATTDGTRVLYQRTRTSIPHNKFIVRLVGGLPVEVWTGSTNFTNTGMFGQTNVGHIVRNRDAATTYLAYWNLVKDDLTHSAMVAATVKLAPNPPEAIAASSVVPFFSPRVADNMLDWYAARIRNARSFAGITIPFNVAPTILGGLDQRGDAFRLAILEEPPTPELEAAEKRNQGKLAFSNGAILGKTFVKYKKGGAKITPIGHGELDQWYIKEELARPVNKGHVFFVHSKFLLVDPLSDDPLVCTGSANFSTNSLEGNDENMLLIRGDTRVADIYFTEFDRIFRHFYARDKTNEIAAAAPPIKDPRLLDTGFTWIKAHYSERSYKNTRRLTFFPPAAPAETWAQLAAAGAGAFDGEAERAAAKRKAKAAAAKKRREQKKAAEQAGTSPP